MMNMKKLFSDDGFFALAFAVVIVSLFSVIAIAHIGVSDSHHMAIGYQINQQLHFMRSEASRGVVVAKKEYEDAVGPVTPASGISSIDLFSVENEIDSGFGEFTFKMRSKVYQEASDEVSPFSNNTVLNISSLGKAYTGFSNLSHYGVSFFSKKVIKNQTFAGFHYFTDTENSINEDLDDPDQVKFWGKDEIHGIVRSNTDIYIQQGGAYVINDGWPLFHDHVYTSGEILSYESGAIPMQDVFQGGWTENLPKVEFPEDAELARNGMSGPDIDPGDAIMAKIEGTNFTLWYMDRIEMYADTVVVYDLGDQFADDPDTIPREDSIGVQYLTKVDTIWTFHSSGRLQDNSIFFEGPLWIEGTFGGKQTWASQDTMYLTGDILLEGTDKGAPPDGLNPTTGEYSLPINSNDYVGLVSEKSILIQYGYRSPEDSVRIKNNCGLYEDLDGDEGDGGIYIYAAMAALGQGEVSMQDGVFSFQYQHPHAGTIIRINEQPDLKENYQDPIPNIYNIAPYDNGWGPLHFFFSDERDMPWPEAFCFPYYGPLWPESQAETLMERGTINLYGSVAQRRRGFVHRSGRDEINTGMEWNIASYHYGAHPRNLQLPNSPGTSGSGVGYNKNYNYDNRFRNNPPPNFPQVHLEGGARELDTESWYLYRASNAPADLMF